MNSITGKFSIVDMNTGKNYLDIDTIEYEGSLANVVDYGNSAQVPSEGSILDLYRNKNRIATIFAGEEKIYIYHE
ncbi:hypothetical protein [Shimazuella alba]|uniref:Uncharacterized protein n=1 Tax=Shimazuella alba TaxID=2690964 RepID=A0A6I4VTZ7_9BACL|nr:hypothetical protein [Shimazuella alba]MXQ53340.1 hypothetical protein [Shimazuella alba]